MRDGVGVVTFDILGAKMNTLTADLNADFAEVMQKINNDSNVQSVVLISGKPDCFIAGADIK